jgi:hypothetical protein
MKSNEKPPFTQWATINRTEKFVSVEPLSGYGIVQRDNDGYAIYLPPGAADEVLGQALLEALDRSRFIWPPGSEPEFFKWQRYEQCYQNWLKEFMRRYGYKTKRDAFKDMDWCRAERSEGKISIRPHKRDKPEYFIVLPADRTVVIPETRDAARAGAALRLALDRCG